MNPTALILISSFFFLTSCAKELPGGLEEDWANLTIEDVEPDAEARRVLGGSMAPKDNSIGALLVQQSSGKVVLCTAAAITPQILLTAGHCGNFAVAMRFTLDNPGTDSKAAFSRATISALTWRALIPYPSSGQADLMVVLLDKDTRLTPMKIGPAVPAPRRLLTVVGFGVATTGNQGAGYRRSGLVAVISRANRYGVYETTGINGQGACHGDSGGPAILSNQIVGIVSMGQNTCNSKSKVKFMAPGPAFSWIYAMVVQYNNFLMNYGS